MEDKNILKSVIGRLRETCPDTNIAFVGDMIYKDKAAAFSTNGKSLIENLRMLLSLYDCGRW